MTTTPAPTLIMSPKPLGAAPQPVKFEATCGTCRADFARSAQGTDVGQVSGNPEGAVQI